MTNSFVSHFDILLAKRAFSEGRNVTETLRNQKGLKENTPEVIETAYDLQAGSYISHVEKNRERTLAYAGELGSLLREHIRDTDSLLDLGTGEMTTLSLLLQFLPVKPRNVLAFDISWSRISKGLPFAKANMGDCFGRLSAFVADIGALPLQDKSISVTTSSHALEPNGGRLADLMAELFRVTRDKLVLFEPCYEMNSLEGRQRMDRLGYIKGIDAVVEKLGGSMMAKIPLHHIDNVLNPTFCFVIKPGPAAQTAPIGRNPLEWFSVPGSNYPLRRVDDFYFSRITGLCYPILRSIPILKPAAAILASALDADANGL
jgi:SAM-dependent methyltransferase